MPRFDPHPELRPAIVTGASAGIGAATAAALAAAGHPVILAARRVERLVDLAAQLEAGGATALALPLDLADPASIDAFADRAADALGPVDILVNNAGVVEIMTGAGADPDEFAASVQVNLLGAHRLAARLAPAMVARGHGDVVFVTSDVVVRPRTKMAAYVTAKAGMEGLARAMQMELEGTGRAGGHGASGPVEHRAGHHLVRGRRQRRGGRLVRLGPHAPRRRAPPPQRGRRHRRHGHRPQGHPPHPHRGAARSPRPPRPHPRVSR